MNPLKRSRVVSGSLLALLAVAVTAPALTGGGCAGVKKQSTTGSGGSGLTGLGGAGGPPPIPGLESLAITPATATVTLTASTTGVLTAPPVQFTATGVVNGVSMDVTRRSGGPPI
jgi:hypothetical protein